jgi:hypothetical protein
MGETDGIVFSRAFQALSYAFLRTRIPLLEVATGLAREQGKAMPRALHVDTRADASERSHPETLRRNIKLNKTKTKENL